MVKVSKDSLINWSRSIIDPRCRLITLEDDNDSATWCDDLASRKMSINAGVISPF